MQRICSSLVLLGYDVTLIGRRLPHSVNLPHFNFNTLRLQCWFNKGFLFYAEYNVRLLIWLLFNSYSIVCAVDLDTIAPAVLASKIKNKKVVYDAHEWFPECPEIVVRPKVKRFWQWMEGTFVPKVDAMYTVSEFIAEVFRKQYHKETGLICNMPLAKGYSNIDVKEDYILYQGALNVGRGLEALIQAMTQIQRKLLIAGNGDIQFELKELVQKLQLEDKVVFLGNLSPEALRPITQKAWLGINLFENLGYNYYYSLANKFFDYVQAGVPQITMDFPEYKRMNEQFEVAILVPDLDIKGLINAIQFIENDTIKYNTLRENCLKAANEWNWENESQKLKDIYGKL
jgi:glycosyltransferase involved in cell wall biosynthesis